MPRLYRKQPDSSTLKKPRVLHRVFVEPGEFERTIRRYEGLMATSLDMDLDARELGIRMAAVGGFLLVETDPSQAERFELARDTPVTMIFADLDSAVEASLALGSEQIVMARMAPVGRAAWMRHADGLLVEYVEHRPGQCDADTPSF